MAFKGQFLYTFSVSVLLKEDQLLIQQSAREFARKVIMPKAAEFERAQRFPKPFIDQAGTLGFLGMVIPEGFGGAGADEVSYCSVLSEISYACASTAVIISVNNMVCWAIHRYGSDDLKKKYLTPLASKGLAAFALTEPNAGSDAAHITTQAKQDGENYLLNGTKMFVTSGSVADVVMVMAVTHPGKGKSGISAFLVERGTPGLVVGKIEDKMGIRASDTAELVFQGCRVPRANLLGKEGEGFKIAMEALNFGRIGIAAQCVGIAEACLDASIAYASQRRQFGKAIAQFEGIQWMIADMATEIEAARALMLHAAIIKDKGREFIKEASMAKLFASEVANRAAYKAVQIHGGSGYLKDFPVERYYRDARVTTLYEGTSEIQRLIIAKHVFRQRGGPLDETEVGNDR